MSAEFIKMISEVQFEYFNIYLKELSHKKTPCGVFFGFEVVPSEVIARVKNLLDIKINLSCVIVLADVQANALRKFIDVPVITLEDFEHFGEENFPVKPQEVFFSCGDNGLCFEPYFARHGMEVLTYSGDEIFFFTMKHLSELYSVYKILGSEESKKVYRAAIKGRLTGKISDYRFAPEPQYFLEGFTPTAGDIAIDGGAAFDGGTAISFAKCGAKVFAFEMNASSYNSCAARIGRFGGGV